MTWRQKENRFKLILNGSEIDIDEPQGFADLESIIERDREAHGTFFEYTPAQFPLRFTGIAKSLLRAQFDNYGVDAQAFLNFETSQIIVPSYEIGVTGYLAGTSGPGAYNLKYGQIFTLPEDGTLQYGSFFISAIISFITPPDFQIDLVLSDLSGGLPNNELARAEDIYNVLQGYNDGDTNIWIDGNLSYHLIAGQYSIHMEFIDTGGHISGFDTVLFSAGGDLYDGGDSVNDAGAGWVLVPGNDWKFRISFQPDPVPTFNGSIDFSQARDDQDYFECSILRSDLQINLKNNLTKKVDLLSGVDIFDNWSYPVTQYTTRFHCFKLKKQWEGETNNIDQILEGGAGDYDAFVIYGGLNVINKNEMNEAQKIDYEFITSIPSDNTVAMWIVDQEIGDCLITVNYDWDYYHYIIADVQGGGYLQTISLRINIYNEDNSLKRGFNLKQYSKSGTISFGFDTELSGSDSGTVQTTELVSLERGDYIKVYVWYDTTGAITSFANTVVFAHTTNSLSANITIDTIKPATIVRGLLLGDALEQCLRSITGQISPMDSDFFAEDGCGHDIFLTNGYQLRGIERPIYASFRDLFHNGCQPILGLGYSVENARIKIELWEYFYQETLLIDLGEVGEYEEQVLGDDIFNQATFGFNRYANDENLASTLDDFHTEGSWNTPIENVSGEFSKISDFILSTFLIEQTRRLAVEEKPTESNRYDDEIFMVALKKDYSGTDFDFGTEQSDAFQIATGMDNIDTAYNLRYTIKRMLLNWGVWINSFAFRYEDEDSELINLYFKNNGDLTTQFYPSDECLLGDTENAQLTEKDNIGKLEIQAGEAKFDQVVIRFTKQLSREQINLIRDAHDGDLQLYQGRYGYIKCTDYNGIEQTGWLLSVRFNYYSNLARFELLKRHIRTTNTIIFDSFCAAAFGYYQINATFTQRVQYISLPTGTLKYVRFNSSITTPVDALIEIRRIGSEVSGTYFAWQGVPLGPDSDILFSSQKVTIFPGDNTLTTNATVSNADTYGVFFKFYRTGADYTVSFFTLDDPPQACLEDIPGPNQAYQSAAWQVPSHEFILQLKLEYEWTFEDLKSLFITSPNYQDSSCFDNIADESGQQIYFKDDATIKRILVYSSHTGSPTGTMKCKIATMDGSGFPDTDLAEYDFTPADGAVNVLIFDQNVDAGDIVVYFIYNNDGVIDFSNKYCLRVITDSEPYQYGAYIFNNGGGGWGTTAAWRMMMKVKYVKQ